MDFSDDFGGLTVLSCVGIGADTIIGSDGSDSVLEDAARLGLLGDAASNGCHGTDAILGDSEEVLCFAFHEIVTGGIGDEVLFGDTVPDLLAEQAGEWAGGAGEDILVGMADVALVPSFDIGGWTDGGTAGTFVAVLDDLKAGGQMIWAVAGNGADTIDLGDLAA